MKVIFKKIRTILVPYSKLESTLNKLKTRYKILNILTNDSSEYTIIYTSKWWVISEKKESE